jgi:uncharacterized protein (TIGR03083 family)
MARRQTSPGCCQCKSVTGQVQTRSAQQRQSRSSGELTCSQLLPHCATRHPARAERERLIATFRAGADRLAGVLRTADGHDPVYTWAPTQHDVAFITRHQVQEAAVHHWDAVRAAGGDLVIEVPVAVDAIEEFLTFSLSTDADPAEPARPALNGRFALRGTDADTSWTISDGTAPGTVAYQQGARAEVPGIAATSSDLLLWLYGRVDLDTTAAPSGLIGRFRALCFTD